MIPCRCGMPRQVSALSPITVTQTLFKRWSGHLMAIASPLGPGIPLCKSGMQPQDIRSLPIEAIPILSVPLHGRPMASVLLRWMTSYECGRPASPPAYTMPYPMACKTHPYNVGAGLAPALVPPALVPNLYCTIGISTPSCCKMPPIPPPETCSSRMKAIVLPLTAYSQCSSGSKTELFVAGMGGSPSGTT